MSIVWRLRCDSRRLTGAVRRWSSLVEGLSAVTGVGEIPLAVPQPPGRTRHSRIEASADFLPGSWLSKKKSAVGRLACLNTSASEAAALGPLPLYHYFVSDGKLRMDLEQGVTVYKLSALFEALKQGHCCSTHRGFYIHGNVGCGKTMAMDIFSVAVHVALPHLRLCRVHLNSFLEMVHSRLKTIVEPLQEHELPMPKGCRFQLDSFQKPFNLGRQDDHGTRRTGTAAGWVLASRKGAEPSTIQRLAHQLSQQMDILCLDEVSITNLQNCVVLGPLIRALCDHGVILIATSNKAPHELYEGGVDRDLHLPILTAAICDNCDILPHASNVDYRALLEAANAESQVFRWHCASERDGDTFVDTWWAALSGSDRMESVPVGYGRSLPVMQSSCQGCVRFDFRDLCTYPPVALGSADYTEICSRFHTLLVSNVPRLRPDSADAARRWTLLVDSCYENHIRLILSTAADDPDDLIRLTSGDGDGSDGQSLQEASFAISRCTSRLREMQSKLYQDACRIRLE